MINDSPTTCLDWPYSMDLHETEDGNHTPLNADSDLWHHKNTEDPNEWPFHNALLSVVVNLASTKGDRIPGCDATTPVDVCSEDRNEFSHAFNGEHAGLTGTEFGDRARRACCMKKKHSPPIKRKLYIIKFLTTGRGACDIYVHPTGTSMTCEDQR